MESDPRVGTELAGYRIECVIGHGGMGVVYRAEQRFPRRKVALKLLAPELAGDEAFRERFLRESSAAAAIDHPHVIPIYEAGEAEGVLFIAMRYVEGTDLRAVLRAEAPLDLERTVSIIDQVGGALDAAHRRELVHRDVKPGNVLVLPQPGGEDFCYLTDFGIAKRTRSEGTLTKTGQLVGTVDYVAPEQIRGTPLDGRADIYSLGCVLYECLTGQPPFVRDTEVAVLYAHLHEAPPPPSAHREDLPRGFDDVVARAMAKEREERYASCAELTADLRRALGGVEAAPPRKVLRGARPAVTRARPSRAETVPAAAGVSRPRDRVILALTVGFLAILPLTSLLAAWLRTDQAALPGPVAPETTATASLPPARVRVEDREDTFFGVDIRQAEVRSTADALVFAFTAYERIDPSAAVRWELDATKDVTDGCGGYEWAVVVDRRGSSLVRLTPDCGSQPAAPAVGRLKARRTATVVLAATDLPLGFPPSFRWHVVTEAGGYRDLAPEAEPARFP